MRLLRNFLTGSVFTLCRRSEREKQLASTLPTSLTTPSLSTILKVPLLYLLVPAGWGSVLLYLVERPGWRLYTSIVLCQRYPYRSLQRMEQLVCLTKPTPTLINTCITQETLEVRSSLLPRVPVGVDGPSSNL